MQRLSCYTCESVYTQAMLAPNKNLISAPELIRDFSFFLSEKNLKWISKSVCMPVYAV